MDFEFSSEQQAFAAEVEQFLDAHDDPEIFDLTRENMAQIVDTPKRREFMAKLGEKGWLGLTWPKEYGGSEGEGVYEYLLNEALAARHMLVEMERTDDVAGPVLVPGNPVKLSKVSEGPETRVPWVGEHTKAVLAAELGLTDAELSELAARGVIT